MPVMELTSDNIGPARGHQEIGRLGEPGLTFLVGGNAEGKSHVLRLLSLLRAKVDQMVGPKGVSITHGEHVGSLSLGNVTVTLRRVAGGSTEVLRDGTADAPVIEALPTPIGTLIDGDGIGDPDARALRRLKALLTLAPLPAPAHVAELLRGLENPALSFADLTEQEIDAVATLSGRARGRAVTVPLRDAAALRAELAGEDWSGKSVLDLVAELADRLNKLGNTCDHAAKAQQGALDGAAAVLEAAWGRLPAGCAEKPTIAKVREVASGPAPTNGLAALARQKLAGLQAKVEAADAEEQRRAGLRAQLAGIVVPDLEALRAELVSAEQAEEVAATAERAASDAFLLADRDRGYAAKRFLAANEQMIQAWSELRGLFSVDTAPMVEEVGRLAETVHRLNEAFSLAGAEVSVALSDRHEATEAALKAESALDRAAEAKTFSGTVRIAAELAVSEASEAVGRRNRLAAELDVPIERPAPEQLTEVEKAIADFEAEAALYAYAKEVAAASMTRDEAGKLLARIETLGAGYRAAAKSVWGRLGALVTLHLRLPYLRLEGTGLFIGFGEDGNLNRTETGWIDEAEAQRVAGEGDGTGLNLARFIADRVATPGEIEWRHVDDLPGVSTAELRGAFLELLLDRSAGQGAWIELPWERLMASFDSIRLRALARRAVDAGLVLLCERPQRDGEPDGLFLERIEPAEGGAA